MVMDEMTPQERQELSRTLEQRLRDLELELHGDEADLEAEHADKSYPHKHDSSDDATEYVEYARIEAMEGRLTQEIRAVKNALGRVDENDFGVCHDCAKPIGLARLRAVPWATRCIQCQEAEEKGC
jgi:DnaK suppressor protein